MVLLAGCQTTSRVSQSSDGAQGDGPSGEPAVSDDGRIVAFTSSAANLVAGDTNGHPDVFVHDRAAGTTTRVSVAGTGAQGDGAASAPAVSGDGRYVAFTSAATNLVAGDTNGRPDVFVHDRQTGATTREGPGGANPTLDDAGSALAYDAGGRLVVRDRQAGVAQTLPTGVGTVAEDPDLSGDGRFVTFIISLEAGADVWLFDRRLQLLDRLSYSADGAYGPQVSDDGATVVWGNGGNDRILMVDDRGVVTSFPGNPTYEPDVSDDGRFVVYRAESDRLVADDTNDQDDTFVYDRADQTVTRASVGTQGEQGDAQPTDAVISGDGRFVAFASAATTLVAGDTNGVTDVFLHDRGEGSTTTPG
jgi:Tol biopolymer transport system component